MEDLIDKIIIYCPKKCVVAVVSIGRKLILLHLFVMSYVLTPISIIFSLIEIVAKLLEVLL
jgi:hypothetical protein